jgi:hypothetical protein
MQKGLQAICKGPIPGLQLPTWVWDVLHRERITTLDQLSAVADRMERVYPGIGQRTAQVIRDEITRVTSSNRP